MAVPVLSAEDRAEALRKALAARRERAEVLVGLKEGRVSLRELLEREDEVTGRTLVVRLLESLPGVGRVRARQALADLDISERRRVRGLGPRQRERLLERFPWEGR